MTFYGLLKKVYHGLLPHRARVGISQSLPGPLRRAKDSAVVALEKTARHDEIYDAGYYAEQVEPAAAISVAAMAATIARDLSPRTVIDVGCGTGALLAALRDAGVAGIGFEYSQAGIDACRARGVDVRRHDIENDAPPPDRADVVVSMEVAEHLPERLADRYVDLLCTRADVLVLTAAVPGQGGHDHVNEQPNSYWIAKVRARGMTYDEPASMRWRDEWTAAGVAAFYARNAMIFRRAG